MRRLMGGVLVIAALLAAPTVAAAQDKMEFGVDVALMYTSPDGGDGIFSAGTPVDVRVGFRSGEKLTWEPRVGLTYVSQSGTSAYSFDLGLNVTYGMQGSKEGMYLTGGAAVNLFDLGAGSENVISLNGGIGTRLPSGVRLEAFVGYSLENTDALIPSSISFGGRVGLSFWR